MEFPWRKRGRSRPESKPSETTAASSANETTAASAAFDHASVRPEDYVGADEARNEQVVRDGFVAKAKHYLRKLPIAEEVVALYFCLLDGKTPIWVKGVAAAALAYFILPLDAVPDFLPIIGLGDDLSVLSAALAAVSTNLTPEHRAKARAWLRHEQIFDAPPGPTT